MCRQLLNWGVVLVVPEAVDRYGSEDAFESGYRDKTITLLKEIDQECANISHPDDGLRFKKMLNVHQECREKCFDFLFIVTYNFSF